MIASSGFVGFFMNFTLRSCLILHCMTYCVVLKFEWLYMMITAGGCSQLYLCSYDFVMSGCLCIHSAHEKLLLCSPSLPPAASEQHKQNQVPPLPVSTRTHTHARAHTPNILSSLSRHEHRSPPGSRRHTYSLTEISGRKQAWPLGIKDSKSGRGV